jgi:hypothetical protein
MSDTAPPAPPPAPAAPPPAAAPVQWNWNQRIAKWVPIIAGVVALIIGAAKISENFLLPSCESSRSLDAIRAIFKDKNIGEPTLTGAKGVTSTSSEKTCQTDYEIPNEKGVLEYRVFWDGWDAKVMITKVN